jgi:uncharacterized membrane protein
MLISVLNLLFMFPWYHVADLSDRKVNLLFQLDQITLVLCGVTKRCQSYCRLFLGITVKIYYKTAIIHAFSTSSRALLSYRPPEAL